MKLIQLASLGLPLLLSGFSYGHPTTTSTSTAPATTHTFIVGSSNGTLRYDPTNITANPGDVVQWSFRAKNHTITQSNFADPCVPLQNSTNVTGFFSGFNPVGEFNSTDFPTYEIVINNTKPIWFYCSQADHCVNGMVGAINANASSNMSFTDFQGLAMKSGIANPVIPPIESGLNETLFVLPMASSGNATRTSAAPASTHTITVGNKNGSLTYNPPNISADIGDMVRFLFMPKNHSVTQSSFGQPCVPLGASENTVGFWSGFNPVSNDQTSDFPTFDIIVNDTSPIWFYCSQTDHCVKGMVGAINANPNSDKSFAAFLQLAVTSDIDIPILPKFITGGLSSIYGWGRSYSSTLSGGSATEPTKVKSLAKGALVGIIVGAAAFVLLSALGLYFCCCRQRGNRTISGSQAGSGGFMGYGASNYLSVNAPAPAPAFDTHLDHEPLVPPLEKGETGYSNQGAYDPPQPVPLGQYSTAWNQHK